MSEGGFFGITVMSGKCPECGKVKTLIPNSDYQWPDREAVWD